ncbi:peptide-methionine (S)-S-oxide reductase [Thermonema lapsum]|uniref:Peptide methionine sulfoxide reductase MsrA n=1 Tax=Thermonema lapsum TaxID=28195 RepID=A0A846MM38_9BACT|nr:peptide-methionine (S)-S-oxide reductase [Thermonema lapsum]
MTLFKSIPVYFLFLITGLACQQASTQQNNTSLSMSQTQQTKNLEIATFGGGCFWCIEAVFQRLKGVEKVVSGYAGGHKENPTYKEVCSGTTGHAEVCQIYYDPQQITYQELLEVFFTAHDPTTLNRQGADVGTQYRSIILYHNEQQKSIAAHFIQKLEESKIFNSPIVTELKPFTTFYPAEDYHQNYYNNNPTQPYCTFVVKPKVEKIKKLFSEKIKY